MTLRYNEWKIRHTNDALPLFDVVSVDEEFASEIELLRQKFEPKKITLTKEITHLKEKKSQFKIDLHLCKGEVK